MNVRDLRCLTETFRLTTTKLTLIEIASNVLLVKKLHVSVRIDPHPVAVGPEGKEKLVASRW